PDKSSGVEADAAPTLKTPAQDYGRFAGAVLNGAGLKNETAAQIASPQIKVGEGSTNSTDRAPEKLSSEIAWGLGWGLQITGEGTALWHWGDNGDSKAYVVAFTRQKLGVVVFTSSG